ncbi:MAG: DUF1636 domain-containing protein [Pseudomonadota bacterium]
MSDEMGEVQVCIECGMEKAGPGERPAGEALFALISKLLEEPGLDQLEARQVACLGNCDADCRVALADPDRWSWMLGQVDPATDEALLREVLQLWLAAPKGLIPKADRPDGLKDKTLGRMPPVLTRNRMG